MQLHITLEGIIVSHTSTFVMTSQMLKEYNLITREIVTCILF